MKSWKVSIEQLRLDPTTYELLDELQKGFQHFGIDYYLVGAISRNAWMNGLHRIVPRRTTTDIDFAVLINDKGRFEERLKRLKELRELRELRVTIYAKPQLPQLAAGLSTISTDCFFI